MACDFASACASIVMRAIINGPGEEREERITLALRNGNITEAEAESLRTIAQFEREPA